MTRTEMLQFLKIFEELNKEGDQWLDRIPLDIKSVFFDNKYINVLYSKVNTLLQLCFSEQLQEELDWFWYDRPHSNQITVDNKTYTIQSIEDFVEYLIDRNLITKIDQN